MPDTRIGLVGPLPPPSGGMAHQLQQLARLLGSEGLDVEVLQTNAPCKPRWVEGLRGIRALFRLAPYLFQLWRTAGRVELFHVMANSGWSWHLYAAPAIWVGWIRDIPVIVNYHGGEADAFFKRSFRWVRPSLDRTAVVVVPSGYLADIFREWGIDALVVNNTIDLQRFTPASASHRRNRTDAPHLLVTRNLEAIYDIDTALRTFHRVQETYPDSRLTVCGSGPELARLEALAKELGISKAVVFTGRIENESMPDLYQSADIMINPSRADNMPISILEALASGVPVVTTDVGGMPYLVTQGKTALLVPPGDDKAMAGAVMSVLGDKRLAESLSVAGLREVRKYTWSNVRDALFAVYDTVLTGVVIHKTGEQDVR